ncbi:hypothetical protein AAG570_006031 [Ranatra chinensis]|uniref:Uncharacterized protein n=1 Tax=Ranatra chinensis TaxID=642074 RepID=A0ABD0XWU8_9HEMI
MASKRRNIFYENKKQETTEIGTCNLPPFCDSRMPPRRSPAMSVFSEVLKMSALLYVGGVVVPQASKDALEAFLYRPGVCPLAHLNNFLVHTGFSLLQFAHVILSVWLVARMACYACAAFNYIARDD